MTEGSILNLTKKMLGLGPTDTAFDMDVVTFINGALSVLTQLGVGPHNGFEIEDAAQSWSDFLGDHANLGLVRSYVYLEVRMQFDPPTNSYLMEAFKSRIEEYKWRINVIAEHDGWISPDLEPAEIRLNSTIDGGTP